MSKLEQVVQIEPQNELKFKGPFNVPVTSYMKLTNPSEKRVMFKIKTTAPKKYCVRPNSGILEPSSNIEIAICLQPFLFDPAEKNKHKFMVQTVFAPEGEVNIDQLWKEIQLEQLMDSKLKCVFELPPEHNDASEEPSMPLSMTSNTVDPDIQKTVQELREEENRLRQENLRLKEEMLQLKQQQVGMPRAMPANRYVPPVQEQSIPMLFVGLAVIMAFVGILLGKFAL